MRNETSLSELINTWISLRWPGETSGLRAGPYPNSYIFEGYAGPEHFDVTTDNGKAIMMRLIVKCIRMLNIGELKLSLVRDGWEVLLGSRRCSVQIGTYPDLVAGILTLLIDYLDDQEGD